MMVKNQEVKIQDLGNGMSRRILAHDGKMMMVEVYFKAGAIGAVHTHFHEQTSYIVKGSFEVNVNGTREILKAGDTFYAGPDISHGVTALEDSVILDVFSPQREDFLK